MTERRSLGWFVAIVINPDSVLRKNPAARELFAEYPMMNIVVKADEAANYEDIFITSSRGS